MSDQPPAPPTAVPDDVVDALDDCTPETLRHLAHYAEELAACRERRARLDGDTATDPDDSLDEPPADVPARATTTIKEINDNRYYYWQWRDGDAIKSRYEGPVDADE